MVSKAEVKVTSFEKLKLWVVEKLKNQSSKSMRTHGSKFGVKTRPQNCQKLENILGNWDFPSPKLQFSSHKIWFSSTAFWFPRNQRKSSSTALRFLQRLSAFFNGFPLSKKSKKIFFDGFLISSTAFQFLHRLSANKLFISWIICSAN